jgi:hypothetical protein
MLTILFWVTGNIQTLNEILSELETEGRKLGLKINEGKTKYMKLPHHKKKIPPRHNNRGI